MTERMRQIPDLLLERYVLGELPPDQMLAVQEQVKKNPDVQKRLEAIENSNREILKMYDPKEETRSIRMKLHVRNVEENVRSDKERKGLFKRYPSLVPAAGLAAILMFSFLPVIFFPGETRAKGDPRLQIFLREESGHVQLDEGDTVRKGDLLQVKYISAGKKYGMIFSLDGRGSITLHFPDDITDSGKLAPHGKDTLEYAYELDDAPNFERFYFITSDKPFDPGAVLKKAKQTLTRSTDSSAVRIMLPENLHQSVFSLIKEKP